MKRPSPEVIFAMNVVARQHRELLTYFKEAWQEELEALPYASETTALKQGRCQVLKEFYELLSKAPDIAADPDWQRRTAHTERSVTNG